uniref:ATP-grasp domain-containing protein n=1 Tax=Zooxanthella nutricula TaxID=1333877 RepID=A0A7S2Q987_9DINO
MEAVSATYWPRSWCVPERSAEDVCAEAFSERAGGALIVKPAAGTHGKGIEIVRSCCDLDAAIQRNCQNGGIVQSYVDRPLLLDGRKWDVRIYALALPAPGVPGAFRVMLAGEGLVRVCVDPYEPPQPRNLHRTLAHLTNYSLSRLSTKYEHSDDPEDGLHGCKRTLSAVLRRIEACRGLRAKKVWRALGAVARGAVDAMGQRLQALAFDKGTWEGGEAFVELIRARMGRCFHLLGLDVLLDEDGNPWLLEVNSNPSLSLEEVRPLAGVSSRTEANQLFVEVKKWERLMEQPLEGRRWGRPCRCAKLPRPHTHHLCPIDTAVKLPIVEGIMAIVRRLSENAEALAGEPADLAAGTVFTPV